MAFVRDKIFDEMFDKMFGKLAMPEPKTVSEPHVYIYIYIYIYTYIYIYIYIYIVREREREKRIYEKNIYLYLMECCFFFFLIKLTGEVLWKIDQPDLIIFQGWSIFHNV